MKNDFIYTMSLLNADDDKIPNEVRKCKPRAIFLFSNFCCVYVYT